MGLLVGSPVSVPVVGLTVVGIPVGALVSSSFVGDRVVGVPVGLSVVVKDAATVKLFAAAEVGSVSSVYEGASEGDSLGAPVVAVVEVSVTT